MDLSSYFADLATMAALVVALSEWLGGRLLNLRGLPAQALSWVIALAVTAVGYLLGLGVVAGLSLPMLIAHGLATGLVANGIFDIKVVQALLEGVKLRLPKKKVTS